MATRAAIGAPIINRAPIVALSKASFMSSGAIVKDVPAVQAKQLAAIVMIIRMPEPRRVGTRFGCPNSTTAAKLSREQLRYLYHECLLSDAQIGLQVGLGRGTVNKWRRYWGIESHPCHPNTIQAIKAIPVERRQATAVKVWEARRRNGTVQTGAVPTSAFKPGHDNGRSGRTWDEVFGPERSKVLRERIANSLKGRFTGEANPCFGRSPSPKRYDYHGGHVESPLQGPVWMRSSWEIEYARYLSQQNIAWLYEAHRFKIGAGATYVPDFYLVEEDRYVEVKGQFLEKDRHKIEYCRGQLGLRIEVVGEAEMQALGLKIRLRQKKKKKPGCDIERCPRCGHQAISCDCDEPDEG